MKQISVYTKTSVPGVTGVCAIYVDHGDTSIDRFDKNYPYGPMTGSGIKTTTTPKQLELERPSHVIKHKSFNLSQSEEGRSEIIDTVNGAVDLLRISFEQDGEFKTIEFEKPVTLEDNCRVELNIIGSKIKAVVTSVKTGGVSILGSAELQQEAKTTEDSLFNNKSDSQSHTKVVNNYQGANFGGIFTGLGNTINNASVDGKVGKISDIVGSDNSIAVSFPGLFSDMNNEMTNAKCLAPPNPEDSDSKKSKYITDKVKLETLLKSLSYRFNEELGYENSNQGKKFTVFSKKLEDLKTVTHYFYYYSNEADQADKKFFEEAKKLSIPCIVLNRSKRPIPDWMKIYAPLEIYTRKELEKYILLENTHNTFDTPGETTADPPGDDDLEMNPEPENLQPVPELVQCGLIDLLKKLQVEIRRHEDRQEHYFSSLFVEELVQILNCNEDARQELRAFADAIAGMVLMAFEPADNLQPNLTVQIEGIFEEIRDLLQRLNELQLQQLQQQLEQQPQQQPQQHQQD